MSVEFRQRTPAEYVRMTWRNKWLIVVPTLAVALAVAWVVRKLPNVYESKSVLIVRPATISANFISQMNESELLFRINAIHQQVVSRSSLEPLIKRYGLYKDEVARGESVETLIERMQTEDIQVQIDRTNNDRPNAFNISFRADDRTAARNVAAELASKYVNAQLEGAQRESVATAEFFDQRVAETKAQLDGIDQRRAQFLQSRIGQLPEEISPLSQRLTGLYEQQKGYITENGRLRDSIAGIESRIDTLQNVRDQQIIEVSRSFEDPRGTQAYATQLARVSQLRAELQELKQTFTDKNPDVISKREQVAEVQRSIDEMFKTHDQRVEQRKKELRERTDPEAATLRTQLRNFQNELRRQQASLAQTDRQIAELESRVNGVPGTALALQQMDREYATLKTVYDDLLAKSNEAQIRSEANANSQGETIQVVDAASLPEKPVAPKRTVLYAFGLALGAGVGLMFVAARELPRLMTVQNKEDAEHYTNLPVLVALPEMLTAREVRRKRVRKLMFATAGLALAVMSVPALIVLFRLTRLFDILSGVN